MEEVIFKLLSECGFNTFTSYLSINRYTDIGYSYNGNYGQLLLCEYIGLNVGISCTINLRDTLEVIESRIRHFISKVTIGAKDRESVQRRIEKTKQMFVIHLKSKMDM